MPRCFPLPYCIYDYKLRHATKGNDFSYEGLVVNGRVVSVYDGDTLRIVFRYKGELQQHNCRMLGYDSPEMKPPIQNKNRELEKNAALLAKAALEKLVNQTRSYVKVECHGFDKYGRILVVLYSRNRCWCGTNFKEYNINKYMIENGFGVPYDGGTKSSFNNSNDDELSSSRILV